MKGRPHAPLVGVWTIAAFALVGGLIALAFIRTPAIVPQELRVTSVIRDVNFAYEPATLHAASTAPVRVTFDNRRGAGAEGSFVPHTFTIDDPGWAGWRRALFGPAVNIKVSVDRLASGEFRLLAGTYEFYCTVYDHRQAGMVGTLVVE